MTKNNKDIENNLKKYPESVDTRVALLESSISHINDTLCRFEKRFDKIDDQFNEMRNEFKEVRKEMKYDFRFLIGAICALAGVIAHGFHWI